MLRKLLSLLSDSAIYGVSSLMSQLIGFLLIPVYSRFLTPADIGILAMISVISLFLAPLAQLGMSNAIFRRFNANKDPAIRARVLSAGLSSVTISSLLVYAIGFIFAESICQAVIGKNEMSGLLRISLVSSAFSSVAAVPLVILRASRKVRTVALLNILKFLLSMSCTIWFVVFEQRGPWGVLVGTLIGETTFLVVQFLITLRSILTWPDIATWKGMIKYSLPFVPHRLQGVVLAMFGQYMVGSMLGLNDAGIYSMATKFALPLAFVVHAIQNAWVAYKFQIHAEDENPSEFFRTAITYYVAGITYLWVGVSIWGPEMVRWMTPAIFHPAAVLVPLAALIPLAEGLYYMFGTGIELTDDTRALPLVSFVGLVVAVAVVSVSIRLWGTAGAMLGSASGPAAAAAVAYYLAQRQLRIPYDWMALFTLMGIALAAVSLGYWSFQLPLIPRLTVAVAISLTFPILEFVVLSRSNSERHRMRILWNKLSWRT